MTLKLGMQHWLLEYYQVCSNDDSGLTLTYFRAWSNLVPYAFVLEKGKTMDFSETFVVSDIKVGRCSQLNEYMNLYEYQRSKSFIDLDPNHSDSIFLKFSSSITADFNISSVLRWAIQDIWSSGFHYFCENRGCPNFHSVPRHTVHTMVKWSYIYVYFLDYRTSADLSSLL